MGNSGKIFSLYLIQTLTLPLKKVSHQIVELFRKKNYMQNLVFAFVMEAKSDSCF